MDYRFATSEDCPLILEFIQELAVYERMESQVVATSETLKEWIFDKGGAEVIFALHEGQPVGFALFFTSFSTFLGRSGLFLEDLFVKPEYRGMGYGKGLLARLAAIAVERGYGRFEWNCLDWNAPSLEFYKSQGAVTLDEWVGHRVTGEALVALAAQAE